MAKILVVGTGGNPCADAGMADKPVAINTEAMNLARMNISHRLIYEHMLLSDPTASMGERQDLHA